MDKWKSTGMSGRHNVWEKVEEPAQAIEAGLALEATQSTERDARAKAIEELSKIVEKAIPLERALKRIADLRFIKGAKGPFDEALDIADEAIRALSKEPAHELP